MIRRVAWTPTLVVPSTVVVGVLLGCAAVLLHRVDLVVMMTPLLAWGYLARSARPGTEVQVETRAADPVGIEGEEMPLHVHAVTPGEATIDVLGLDLAPLPRIGTDPVSGALHTPVSGNGAEVSVRVRPLVWGVYPVARGELRATSAWAGYMARDQVDPHRELAVLPAPRPTATTPRGLPPALLIGGHTSRRPGEGSEFAEIREFRPGDRVRRVHWPTSARRGALHVRTQEADRDAVVVLVVDATNDIPALDPARPSGMERAVQAAAQIAGRLCGDGDRVALRVVGARSRPVPAASGTGQLHRILAALAHIEVGAERDADPVSLRLPLPAGAAVVALTPMTVPAVVDAVVAAARQGHAAVVVDVAPADTPTIDEVERLGWRILQLERAGVARGLRSHGVPVLTWRDDHGADDVWRSLHHLSRVARR